MLECFILLFTLKKLDFSAIALFIRTIQCSRSFLVQCPMVSLSPYLPNCVAFSWCLGAASSIFFYSYTCLIDHKWILGYSLCLGSSSLENLQFDLVPNFHQQNVAIIKHAWPLRRFASYLSNKNPCMEFPNLFAEQALFACLHIRMDRNSSGRFLFFTFFLEHFSSCPRIGLFRWLSIICCLAIYYEWND
jgi:hypothetical protein